MTTQTQTPEERLSKLEGAYEQANERFNDLAQAIREGDAALREEIRQGDAALREADAALRANMNERFNELARGQEALAEQIRQGDANLRQVETNLRAEMSKQFHTLLVLLGTFWATMLGGIIAILVRG